jgi:hypothetical protein
MSDQFLTSLVTVATAIIGVAILAVLVSKNAQTSNVISATSSGFSQGLGTALSPLSSGGGLGNGIMNSIGGGAGNYVYN